jgi:Rap1a immunity proteins
MNAPTATGCRPKTTTHGVNDMKAIVASALMLISTAMMASAAEKDADISTYSADYWLPYCKEYIDGNLDYLPNFCAGMIFGIGILLREDPKSPLYCVDIPEGIKFEQAIRVVIRYIEEHSQDMYHPFKYLALVAIMDAWPVRNNDREHSGRGQPTTPLEGLADGSTAASKLSHIVAAKP